MPGGKKTTNKREPIEEDDSVHEEQLQQQKELQRKIAEKIRKEQEQGPPPDMKKRQLIFDSLSKIISRHFGKGSSKNAIEGETRGTYVFTWGAGYHGQLGRRFERGKKKYATIPKMVAIDIAVRQVACGGLHTAAVTDAGTVYTWGDARAHQLGYQPHGFTNQPTPHLVESLDGHAFITHIACGQSHTVALTDKGVLISWGLSKFGQGGHNDRQMIKTPRKIRMDENGIRFIDVSCGDKHTVALTDKGHVYTFGCAQQGQLGHNESPPTDKLKPTLISSLLPSAINSTIVSVVAGSIHTCCVTDNGEIYCFGFGENFYPKEENQNFYYYPLLIPFSERVVQLACGQSHILALTDRGDVYTWGSGAYGQLGHGVKGNLNTPRLVLTGKSVAQVSAGRYHSLALTSFGALYSWGCGENGQLGHHNDENILFPKVIEPNIGSVVGLIACGEHHSACLSATPWIKMNEEMSEWLQGEKEEYMLKLKYLKKTNHGLVKKDLMKIREKMIFLKDSWMNEKMNKMMMSEDEQKKDVDSVKSREQIINDILQTFMENETKKSWMMTGVDVDDDDKMIMNQSTSSSIHPALLSSPSSRSEDPHHHHQERDRDRPDSASQPMTNNNHNNNSNDSNEERERERGLLDDLMEENKRKKTMNTQKLINEKPLRPRSSHVGSMTSRESYQDMLGGAGGQSFNGSQTARLSSSADVRQAGIARSSFLKEGAAMVKRMKAIVQETGDATSEPRLKRMIALVFNYRKDYDHLRCVAARKLKQLQDFQRQYDAMNKVNDSTKQSTQMSEHTLKALKMKLSTVTIKITETEENRKNYALNIAHLKEEELERYYQLEGLRKKNAENESIHKKINDMKHLAMEEKERADNELMDFKREITNFQSFIYEQLNKFHSISSLAHERKEKRDAEKDEKNQKFKNKISARIDRLTDEMEEKNKEAMTMTQQLESVNERLRYFEKRFQQVASATGLTDPDDIINKFSLKEEIKHDLNIEIQEKQQIIQKLKKEASDLQHQLSSLRINYVESKWKDIDSIEEIVNKSKAKAAMNKLEMDRALQRIAYFKEGIVTLMSMLPAHIVGNEDDWNFSKDSLEKNPELVLDLLCVLSDKISLVVQQVDTVERERKMRENEILMVRKEREQANANRAALDAAEKMRLASLMNTNKRPSSHNQRAMQDDDLMDGDQ